MPESPTASHVHRRRLGRRSLALIAWAGLGASAGGMGIVAMSGAGKPAQPSVQRAATSDEPADVGFATVMSFDVTTTATGELEAKRQIDIRNQLEQPTTIIEIVKEGVPVKTGDVLVRLNAEAIQTLVDEEGLRVETANADAQVADNNYQIQMTENESALRKAALDIEVARIELRKWEEGEVVSRRQANQLALERAKRELERLKDKYEQSVTLEKRGFLAKDDLKRDELAYLEAEAALTTATLNIRVYDEFEYRRDAKLKQSAVDQAEADLIKIRSKGESELASKLADKTNKHEQARLRKEKLDRYRQQLDLAVLKAPSDGLVVYATSLNRDRWGGSGDGVLDVGKQVTRNQQLIVLPDTSEMVASVRVHESLTGRIRKGQPATVKIDALGGRSIPGTIEGIGVIAESGGWRDPNLREYTVKIRLDTEGIDVQLKPSMRAEAQIFLDKIDSALAVPIQAVFSDGLVRYVLVPQNGRYTKLPVRVGRRSDRFAEITVGLKEGDRVLLREAQQGELIEQPWDKAQLAAVGLNLTPDGRITPVMGAAGPRPGMGGAPAGAAPGGEDARSKRPRDGGGPTAIKSGPSAGTPEPSTPAAPALPTKPTTEPG